MSKKLAKHATAAALNDGKNVWDENLDAMEITSLSDIEQVGNLANLYNMLLIGGNQNAIRTNQYELDEWTRYLKTISHLVCVPDVEYMASWVCLVHDHDEHDDECGDYMFYFVPWTLLEDRTLEDAVRYAIEQDLFDERFTYNYNNSSDPVRTIIRAFADVSQDQLIEWRDSMFDSEEE